MSDKKHEEVDKGELIVAKAKDFWTRNSKYILGIGTVLLLVVGGYYVYQKFFKEPKEQKALSDLFMAESYYRMDSFDLALKGDNQYPGLLKVINNYGGTDAANLAHFYAGVCYIHLNDNQSAINHLKKFSTSAKQVQQRAYKLMGDAYADQGNYKDALDYYKKAADHFEKDKANSAEALDLAAGLAAYKLNDQPQAIKLYTELKEKFPQTAQGQNADKYLAKMSVYNVN
jgi:tetratricopeptide (TPR) repeat protein